MSCTTFPKSRPLREDAAESRHGGASGACMGAVATDKGTCFKLWAPQAGEAEIVIMGDAAPVRRVPLQALPEGWHEGTDAEGMPGDRYKIRLAGIDMDLPDPASRWQPEGPHGPSMVIDSRSFSWTDGGWQRPAMRDLVIYELHIGTFTPEGTFKAAIEKLPHVKELGVNAIELMPVAEFAGLRNWGYDGVCLFAPAHAYGHPDDLRALVNEAHRQGIAVILDVVYNHFGPDGNYLALFIGDYLDEEAKTPWGGAIRYGHPDFAGLRQMLVCNVQYWMREFHIDGFRLDATHAIQDGSPVHVLQEVTAAVHAAGGFIIAEDCRNDARLCEPQSAGGLGFDAVWADDFHHVLRVGQTGETAGYYGDFRGSAEELCEVLEAGWLYQGQHSASMGVPRGTPSRHLAPSCFITCISNHDQAGNRAFGERLHESVSPAAYRALSALLCLSPFTPMLFMGQEWAASSPFLFFTDHGSDLGKLITAGRRGEFAAFPEFSGESLHQIPDPQLEQTFQQSKLRWAELGQAQHAQIWQLYRECLRLRKTIPLLRGQGRRAWRVRRLPGDVIVLHYEGDEGGSAGHDLIIHLKEKPVVLSLPEICPAPGARLLLSSNERRFGGERGEDQLADASVRTLALAGPEVLLVGR